MLSYSFVARSLASSNLGETTMKRFLAAIVLACVLSVSALAGDIPTSGFASPQPPPTSETTSAPSPGDIPSDGAAQPTIGDQVIANVLGILSAGYLSIY